MTCQSFVLSLVVLPVSLPPMMAKYRSACTSAIGSAALNQKLSVERASAVSQYLEQDANVPLTNMLAPGAMGTPDQVAPDKTAEGRPKTGGW
jgi:hypothetical protein